MKHFVTLLFGKCSENKHFCILLFSWNLFCFFFRSSQDFKAALINIFRLTMDGISTCYVKSCGVTSTHTKSGNAGLRIVMFPHIKSKVLVLNLSMVFLLHLSPFISSHLPTVDYNKAIKLSPNTCFDNIGLCCKRGGSSWMNAAGNKASGSLQ